MNTERKKADSDPTPLDVATMEARLEMETVIPTTAADTTPICVCHF